MVCFIKLSTFFLRPMTKGLSNSGGNRYKNNNNKKEQELHCSLPDLPLKINEGQNQQKGMDN